jgi:hypothetical protein
VDAINSLFTSLLNLGTSVAVIVAAFFLMLGGYQYMSAGGNPHDMEKGKAALRSAVAGLFIVLSARVLAGVVQSALTSGS